MSDDLRLWIGLCLGTWVGVLAALVAWDVPDRAWKAKTVERGLAMYCPDNGQWAWNGECGK